MREKVKMIAAAAVCAATGVALISDAAGVREAAAASVRTCLYVIIPSLFAFMALSSYLTRSGLYRCVFKLPYLILGGALKLNEEEFALFMLGLIGGYPVGAKLLTEKSKSDADFSRKAENMLGYCYCGSPVYIVTIAGVLLFGSVKAGLLVYACNAAACLITALFINRKNGLKPAQPSARANLNITQNTFISSVLTAGETLFPVCAMIIFFGIITRLFEYAGGMAVAQAIAGLWGADIGTTRAVVLAAAEISNCAALPADVTFAAFWLPFIAALTSTGGLCVIMQVNAIVGGGFKTSKFLLARIPAALLSALICRAALLFVNIPAVAANAGTEVVLETAAEKIGFSGAGNPLASAALLMMTILLLKIAKESEKKC